LSVRAALVEAASADQDRLEAALREFRDAAGDVQERLWPMLRRSVG